jgi:hypothetical protein
MCHKKCLVKKTFCHLFALQVFFVCCIRRAVVMPNVGWILIIMLIWQTEIKDVFISWSITVSTWEIAACRKINLAFWIGSSLKESTLHGINLKKPLLYSPTEAPSVRIPYWSKESRFIRRLLHFPAWLSLVVDFDWVWMSILSIFFLLFFTLSML